LWGVTNPFIRLGSQGIESVRDTGSKWRNFVQEACTIGSRWRYWIPFGLNQCGSALYVWTLQSASITVAVPVANSLSFAFTAITGYALGEKLPGRSKWNGIARLFSSYIIAPFSQKSSWAPYSSVAAASL